VGASGTRSAPAAPSSPSRPGTKCAATPSPSSTVLVAYVLIGSVWVGW